jgi:hypothetical protein
MSTESKLIYNAPGPPVAALARLSTYLIHRVLDPCRTFTYSDLVVLYYVRLALIVSLATRSARQPAKHMLRPIISSCVLIVMALRTGIVNTSCQYATRPAVPYKLTEHLTYKSRDVQLRFNLRPPLANETSAPSLFTHSHVLVHRRSDGEYGSC